MKRITQFILCIVLAVSAYGQGVGGNSVPRTVSGISAALDLISSTQGTIFYRGASGWEALPPGTSGQLFSTQGAAANPIWVTATGGAGDVNGPTLGTATDNAIVRFDGTGGKTVQNSAVTIADTTGAMTWATGQAATLTGGDNGASLVLGHSGNGAALLNSAGSGAIVLGTTAAVSSEKIRLHKGSVNGTGNSLLLRLSTDAKTAADGIITTYSALNSSDASVGYGGIGAIILNPTAGSVDGALTFQVAAANANNERMRLTTNLLIGTTTDMSGSGGAKIAGTTPSTGVGTGALQVAGGIYAEAASVFGGAVTANGQLIGKGTATNDSAATGYIGEYVSSTVSSSSPVSLTTATPANITSISLTAGDWDVEANVFFAQQAGTTSTYLIGGLSATTATLPSNNDGGRFNLAGYAGNAIDPTLKPARRYSLSATTTIYIVAQAGFSGGTCSAFGQLYARRVR